MMVAATARLFVFQSGAQEASGAPRNLDLKNSPPGIDHIGLLVDVDKSYRERKSERLGVCQRPADQTFGARTVAVRDPDGNDLYLLKWLAK